MFLALPERSSRNGNSFLRGVLEYTTAIHGIIHFLFFRSAKVKNKTGIITFILPESVFPIIEEKISLPVSRRILTGRLITLTLKTHHSIRHPHQEEKSFNSSFNRLRMKNKRLFTVPIGNPNFSAISLYLNPATNI